jgi:hypothetical protein
MCPSQEWPSAHLRRTKNGFGLEQSGFHFFAIPNRSPTVLVDSINTGELRNMTNLMVGMYTSLLAVLAYLGVGPHPVLSALALFTLVFLALRALITERRRERRTAFAIRAWGGGMGR